MCVFVPSVGFSEDRVLHSEWSRERSAPSSVARVCLLTPPYTRTTLCRLSLLHHRRRWVSLTYLSRHSDALVRERAGGVRTATLARAPRRPLHERSRASREGPLRAFGTGQRVVYCHTHFLSPFSPPGAKGLGGRVDSSHGMSQARFGSFLLKGPSVVEAEFIACIPLISCCARPYRP